MYQTKFYCRDVLNKVILMLISAGYLEFDLGLDYEGEREKSMYASVMNALKSSHIIKTEELLGLNARVTRYRELIKNIIKEFGKTENELSQM